MMGNINPAFLCKFSLYFSAERTKTPLFCYTNPGGMLRKLRSGTKTIHIHKDSLQQASMLWFSGFVPLESGIFQKIQLQGALQRRHRHICAWNHEGGLQNTAWNLVVVVWNSKWHQGEKDWKCALCCAREGAAKGLPANQIIPSMNKHPQTRGDPRNERDLWHLGKRGGKGRQCEGMAAASCVTSQRCCQEGTGLQEELWECPNSVCRRSLTSASTEVIPQKGRDQHCRCFTALASHRAGSCSFRPRLRGCGDATSPLPSHFCHTAAQALSSGDKAKGSTYKAFWHCREETSGSKWGFPPAAIRDHHSPTSQNTLFGPSVKAKRSFCWLPQLLEAPLRTPNKH